MKQFSHGFQEIWHNKLHDAPLPLFRQGNAIQYEEQFLKYQQKLQGQIILPVWGVPQKIKPHDCHK